MNLSSKGSEKEKLDLDTEELHKMDSHQKLQNTTYIA